MMMKYIDLLTYFINK